MKNLVLSAAMILMSGVALAAPQKGDYSILQYGKVVNGKIQGTSLRQKAELTDYDATDDSFTMQTTLYDTAQNNKVLHSSTDSVAAKDLNDGEASIADLLKNCAAQGGTPQKITVPAGSFDTCKVQMDANTFMWLGDVVNGAVQVVKYNANSNGDTIVLGLADQGHGAAAPAPAAPAPAPAPANQ